MAHQFLAALFRWLWLIVLFGVLAGGVAFLVALRTPPSFEASSTLLVAQGNPPAGVTDPNLVAADQQTATYADWITRRPILDGVIAQLGLKEAPDALAQAVSVQPVRGTQLLTITVTDGNPERAAAIANALPKVFIGMYHDVQAQRLSASEAGLLRSLSVTQAQIADLQGRLDAAQGASGDPTQARTLQTLLTQQQTAYANLLQSYEVLHANETATRDDIIVVEPASVPTSPAKPNRLLNTLLGVVVGMVLAGGLAFVIESLEKSAPPRARIDRRHRYPAAKLLAPPGRRRAIDRAGHY